MNCRDCLHYEVCESISKRESLATLYCAEECPCFKDKSDWAHLPCKCGDKIFMIVGDLETGTAFVDEGKVISVTYEHTGVWIYARYGSGLSYHHKFGCGDCFFHKEEAEKALAERKEK